MPTTSIYTESVSWLNSARGDKIIHRNVRIAYWIIRIITRPLRRGLNIEVTEPEMVHGSRYVIAANHQSVVDPFVIGSQIPFNIWRHFGIIRFFGANYLFKNNFIRPFLLGFGCFPAQQHHKYPYGLDYGTGQLKIGRSLLIFPEGRRAVRGTVTIRKGIEVLAKEPNAMVVPAHIEWRSHFWGRSFAIGVGKPFDASNMTADEIMDQIYAVPVKR